MFHLLAIPVALLLLKALVDSVAHRSVDWADLLLALPATGKAALVFGIIGQVAFAFIAAAGAAGLRSRLSWGAIVMIVSGVIGAVFSFVVFGGFMGIIGGILTFAGGAVGLPTSTPVGYGPVPPPYRPPEAP